MKKIFLYKLFHHSAFAGVLVVIFISAYTVSFYKKMDMLFFPYNNMYSIDFNKGKKAITYAVKLNGNLVEVTKKPYWKKDFLETSLNAYAGYIKKGNRVFMDDYLEYKFRKSSLYPFLSERLVPRDAEVNKWPVWYCAFAGYDVPADADLEIQEYHFLFKDQQAIISDSFSILKTVIP